MRVAHGHHRTTFRQIQTTIVDVAPSNFCELAVVSITPKRFAYKVVAAPRFLSKEHRRFLAIRLQRICSADVVPVDDASGTADDIVLVEALDDGDEAVETRQINVVLAVPDGFAHVLGHLALLGCQLYLAVGVGTNGVEGIAQLFILLHALEEIHLLTAPVAEAVELDIAEAAFVHGLAQVLGEVGVPAFLIVTTQGIKLEAVHMAQSLEPGDVVVHHVVAPEVAHPGGGAPRCSIKSQSGVAPLGLLHHPPHIAAQEIGVVALVGVRWHGALRAVAVARHLDEDSTHGSSEHRLIDHVHNLRALGLRIVLEEHGSSSATINGSDAVELFAASLGAQLNCLCRCACPCEGQKHPKQDMPSHHFL